LGYQPLKTDNRGAVRRVLRWTLVLLLTATLLYAGKLSVTYTAYNLTCCTQADIHRLWQPGTTVELHWMVESRTRIKVLDQLLFDVSSPPDHRVVITAFLTGPATAGLGYRTVHGSVIAMDDRTPPSTTPVTTFLLPTDLPPGYYNLGLDWSYRDGGIGDPTNFVRVGTQ
jgi:hypothetical protein